MSAEIAAALYVGDGTGKAHVAHVLAKLGLRDHVQTVFACESGLIQPGDRDEGATSAASG